jgi:hypothetical protein
MPTSQANRTRSNSRNGEVSRDASRYKWVDSDDSRPDHNGQTLATKDHDVIRHWAEARGGKPATTTSNGRPRVLRIDFPGYGGDSLRKISWDDWFNVFDQRGVTFLFQENLRSGNQSNFSRLTRPAA